MKCAKNDNNKKRLKSLFQVLYWESLLCHVHFLLSLKYIFAYICWVLFARIHLYKLSVLYWPMTSTLVLPQFLLSEEQVLLLSLLKFTWQGVYWHLAVTLSTIVPPNHYVINALAYVNDSGTSCFRANNLS